MIFSSILFISLFLPITIVVYYVIPNRSIRNVVLTVASFLFYAWGEPIWVLILTGACVLNFFGAQWMRAARTRRAARIWFFSLLFINLAPLILFKYLNFVTDNVTAILGLAGSQFRLPLPVGISFYLFQSVSYVADVYRKETTAQQNFINLTLYLSMFFQLTQGPVVKYSDIAGQLLSRRESVSLFAAGMFRFSIGLGKKAIFAYYAGVVSETLFGQLDTLSIHGAWAGIFIFSLQFYFDFAGYSDMAVGLAQMFGFDIMENFQYPYISRSMTEFWRRWHRSMSFFFRDYIYIPLGGNRKHPVMNVWITWFLTGLWHGAGWNFILWGLYNATLLQVEKLLRRFGIYLEKPPVLSNVLMLFFIALSWSLLHFKNMQDLLTFLRVLFGLGGRALYVSLREASAIRSVMWLLPLMAAGATPIPARLANALLRGRRLEYACKAAYSAALLLLCFVLMLGQSYSPFLYAQF